MIKKIKKWFVDVKNLFQMKILNNLLIAKK